jgi:cytochrome P450
MHAIAYPPGPRSRYPGAHLLAFRRDSLGFLTQVALAYGDIAHAMLGRTHIYLLNHPDYIKDVLVTSQRRFTGLAFEAVKCITGDGLLSVQGEVHRRHRRLMQPAFHHNRLLNYGATMVEHTRRWCDRQRDGAVMALRSELRRLTLGIVGETMFGATDGSAADDVREFIDAGAALFGPLTLFLPVARLMERLPLPSARRFIAARERLDTRVYRMLHERRASGVDRGDLLSMLLLAEDEEGDGQGLTDRQIRDEVVTIFLAGHETTASALTWSWYLLAQHPEAERRLHAEIDQVLGDRPPTPHDLHRLPYANGIFAEALRLYPTAAMIFRRALEDHAVGRYTIPKGSVVIMSQYVMHRDPRFYPDPDLFDPGRWAPEVRDDRPRYCYFPFGGGPRVCIGEGFASMEGVLVLATMAQRWRLRLSAEPPPPNDPSLGTRPSDELRMWLERRALAPAGSGWAQNGENHHFNAGLAPSNRSDPA